MQGTPFQGVKTIEEAINNLNFYLRTNHNKARLSVITISEPLEDIFSNREASIDIKTISPASNLYKAKLKYHRLNATKYDQLPEWLFWRYKDSDVYLLISCTKYNIFYGEIWHYLNRFYPKISRVFYNTYQIRDLLSELAKPSSDMGIRISKIVGKKRIVSDGARKSIGSRIDWTDISFKEAFSRIIDQNLWLKSLDFSIRGSANDRFVETIGSISRDGMLVCKDNFILFFNLLIIRALEAAKKDNDLLKNRARSDNEKLQTRPLKVNFSKNIFKDKAYNHRLYSSLKGMKYCGISAFHSNPYFHASVIDYKDGSTYRVWVLSDDTITIVPQMRSTVASLERLINHIGESFMEGEVSDLYQGVNGE